MLACSQYRKTISLHTALLTQDSAAALLVFVRLIVKIHGSIICSSQSKHQRVLSVDKSTILIVLIERDCCLILGDDSFSYARLE
jgi:hypothetical protein